MKTTIAVLGSHSALDVCRGAKDEGFSTLVIAQKGREKTYTTYFGCVDRCIVINKFRDILDQSFQKQMQQYNPILIPHRSLEAYLDFDYHAIENDIHIPFFGNKYLLKIEERKTKPNQYDVLDVAGIRYPKHFTSPRDIDRLCIVKVSERERSFERAFFLVSGYKDYVIKSKEMISAKKITKDALKTAVIEEFIMGTPVNFNFFYSPMYNRLELMGTDTRRQTNLDGFLRVPAMYQDTALLTTPLTFEESGHIAVTVLESMLEKAFELGESFVRAAKKLYPPGVIGPFALQSIITSGPPKKDIVVIDVSPRMPGSPGIASGPYSGYLWGESLSAGHRVAKEIKEAVRTSQLKRIVT
jgi:5-formaminoimidazole-4-carboxamide-1-(beta)-D-ribofuranosyl 5'-monophosphate synthetase